MYPPHYEGGYELIWRSAVEHLRQHGHEVRVLVSDYRAPDVPPGATEDLDVHRDLLWYWRDHEFPRLRRRGVVALERHNASTVDRHLRQFRPDVVSWWAMGGMSLSVIERVRAAGIPAAGVVCDDWLLYGPKVDQWLQAFTRRRRLRTPAQLVTGVPTTFDPDRAARWLFMSETLRQRTREGGLSLTNTAIAYRGIDRSLFPRSPEQPWRFRLLYVGRIDPRKGIDTAIRALSHLPAEATLTVVGRGDASHEKELRQLAGDEAVEARVKFVGPRPYPMLAELYAGADVVVFPVLWDEPWGLVPLEAMNVGRPVVATGTGGSGEYLRHEENCLLFHPTDSPEALATGVLRLSEDSPLRSRLVLGGSKTAALLQEATFNDAVAAELQRALEQR